MPQIPPIEKIYARLVVVEKKQAELEAELAKKNAPPRRRKKAKNDKD